MAATKIMYSESNTLGVNAPLFTFDSVYDTDFGMLALILREYFDTDIFSEKFFKDNEYIEDMVRTLATRQQENPLLLAMNDKNNYELADDIYSEFYNNKYNEILMYSMTTAVNKLAMIMNNESGTSIGFLVAREEEKIFLETIKLCDKANYININNKEELSMVSLYNQIYFKSCNDRFMNSPDLIDAIYEKNIYIPRYPFNLDDEGNIFLTKSILQLQMNRCSFFKYDMYDLSETYNEEEEPEEDELA